MTKSSSLCLYSSNVRTFWLQVEQFCPLKKFLFLVMAAILDIGRYDGHNFERGQPKDHFRKVWLRLAQ